MALKDNKITLLNYNPFTVIIPSETRTYVLDPCYDYNIPKLINVSHSDVEYMNSHSDVFRNGTVFFEKDKQEEIYKDLSIFDWKDILTNQAIENILLSPTLDGLQRLIDVKDDPTFNRIYSILVHLKNSNRYDLSSRVIKVIEARRKELHRGIYTTQIVLQERTIKPNSTSDDVNALKKQIANMQKMMSEMLAKQDNSTEKTSDDVTDKYSVKKPAKRAGRPPKATK